MSRLRQRLNGKTLTVEQFKALAEQLRREYPTIEFNSESLVFPREGSRLVEAFVNSAYAMRRPHEVSSVVITPYGYHVLYLEERIPALHTPLEQADQTIRKHIFDEVRTRHFTQSIDELARKTGVQLYPERLSLR